MRKAWVDVLLLECVESFLGLFVRRLEVLGKLVEGSPQSRIASAVHCGSDSLIDRVGNQFIIMAYPGQRDGAVGQVMESTRKTCWM